MPEPRGERSVPTSAPPHPSSAAQITPPPKQFARTWTTGEAVDGVFFLIATALVFWLGWVLLRDHRVLAWGELGRLVVFWALVAYVGLPRLQQVLTKVYVPDYFIGRTTTSSGILGDPVNLGLLGSADQVHAAMTTAGWTRADEVTLRSSWGIVVSALLRRPYPAAPVSPLLLFGRPQAFAYEMEVGGDASRRHHVRFWPTPPGWVLPGDHRVDWLAAGTFDRAVGLSLFTLQVTHKIDADIDVERDHVVATVRSGVPEARTSVLRDFVAGFHARNGGGDVVRTDGSLVVLDLTPVPQEPRDPAPSPAPSTGESRTGRVAPSDDAGDVRLLVDRRSPPVELVIAGVVSVLQTAASVSAAAPLVVAAVLSTALWLGVLARRAWARAALMAVCSVQAAALIHLASGASGHRGLSGLLQAGASVLVLVTVSSDGARRWVSARRGGRRPQNGSRHSGPSTS